MNRIKLSAAGIAVATAIVVFLAAGGAALALSQFVRSVAASVAVQVVTPDGIEVYLDEDLTQVADQISFGEVEVDFFGTVRNAAGVPVWIKNDSLSTVLVSIDDDFNQGDVSIAFDGNGELNSNEVARVNLSLRFHGGVAGNFDFTIFFMADGPFTPLTPTPTPTPAVAPTLTATPVHPTATPAITPIGTPGPWGT